MGLKYSSKTKRKVFTINDKISIIAQVDAHIGACVELASQLGLPVFTLDTTVKNHEKIERYVVQCGPFSRQWRSLKRSPMEELQSAIVTCFSYADFK